LRNKFNIIVRDSSVVLKNQHCISHDCNPG
jgi:hypothetical protein